VALRFVPERELERIRAVADPVCRAALLADACRVNTLYMIMRAGSGHIGTSFSAMEILCWLHAEALAPTDRAFSSKGHDAPGTYAVLAAVGRIPFERIHTLRRLDGLPGHPDVALMSEVVTSTGSLGMGISKARGFALADRLAGRSAQTYVITGDGELQEGQFWESLQPTANRRLGEITVIVDHNKLQSDTWVSEVSDLGDLETKIRGFGWAVARCDGNDVAALAGGLAELGRVADGRPQLLIADTIKGHGVSFMEPGALPVAGDSLYAYHSGAPSPSDYERGTVELTDRLNRGLAAEGLAPVVLEAVDGGERPAPPAKPQRLIAAYGEALAAAAARRADVVVLDGDLSLDTGLTRFRAEQPARFFECGIAEQDMVSMAGTMALSGLLPIVHSFACFLTARANEQIYNNVTEGTKVIYAGSLAGIVPGGPGHSHQSVRDIADMGAMPGMALLEPYCESEAAAIVDWAIDAAESSVYIRLISVPWDLGFDPPPAETLLAGRGTVLREGEDVVIVATGPVLISQAWAAAELLATRGVSAGLVALPWLRDVDGAWLADVAAGAAIVTLDNHYVPGGQGMAVLAALAEQAPAATSRVLVRGVVGVPRCGRNDEVLGAHRLDRQGIAEAVLGAVRARGAAQAEPR
jgi:transketolase